MTSVASHADLQMAAMTGAVALVLLAGTGLGRLAGLLRQPPVIGEVAAGIALGPSLLGLLPGDLVGRLFPAEVRSLLGGLSQVGLLLFMFMIGWQFERSFLRTSRGTAGAIALCCLALAFVLGAGLALVLYDRHADVGGHRVDHTAFVLFLGAAMSVTAFPVLARIITDNGLSRTRVGALALACAAVDDVIAWCLLAWVSGLVSADGDVSQLYQIGVLTVVYVAGMVLLVRPLLQQMVERMAAREAWRPLFVLLCAGALLSAWATTWIGIHAIFGAFLFGCLTPREPAGGLAEYLARPLDSVAAVLLPVFFIVTGLSVDLGALTGRDWQELVAVIAVATVGKIAGAVVPARLLGLPWVQARALGLLMNTRGLTELIILNAALTLGVLDGRLFTMMVVMALVTTATAGPLLPRDAGALGLPSATAEPQLIPTPMGAPS